jgi:eukaryotic-like serine/threonine-protein kinase
MSDFTSELKLGKEIASGFFGKVFIADDPVRGTVAVKRLHQFSGESDADWNVRKETLLHEAQMLVQAEHPNIVRVHQLVRHSSDDTLHLAMELCQGSLQMSFDAGPLPLYRVQRIASDTLLGLDALHSRGMLHRDIKPGNILLDKHGTAKIGDFGLVTDDLILGYGSGAGYSNHLAPEVWAGLGTSVKSDVWAVGMTLFRLMHGRQWCLQIPSASEEVKKGNFAQRLPWLPHVSDSWRRVNRKAMHDDTTQRYQNAAQFLNAISAVTCEPKWECRITPGHVVWERSTDKRQFKVQWLEHSPNKHEWSAASYPIGYGNKRNLGNATSGKKDCIRALEKFFST